VTRQQKTPQQRAEEQLGVADRLVSKLTKKAKTLRGELDDVEREQRAAVARRNYLKQHPDLQPQATTSTQPGGTTA
jgi:hypothetical protein